MSPTYLEIERKFLIRSQNWPAPHARLTIRQAYLTHQNGLSVRVRDQDGTWSLTLKTSLGPAVRREYEVPIAADMGEAMMRDACPRAPVEKTRLIVMDKAQRWEIDQFTGTNAGLLLAEAELGSPDQLLLLPDWVGPEVTGDARFSNQALSLNPFSNWGIGYDALLREIASG